VKIAFIIAHTRNNVVVLFGTLKVQFFMLTEVRDCDRWLGNHGSRTECMLARTKESLFFEEFIGKHTSQSSCECNTAFWSGPTVRWITCSSSSHRLRVCDKVVCCLRHDSTSGPAGQHKRVTRNRKRGECSNGESKDSIIIQILTCSRLWPRSRRSPSRTASPRPTDRGRWYHKWAYQRRGRWTCEYPAKTKQTR